MILLSLLLLLIPCLLEQFYFKPVRITYTIPPLSPLELRLIQHREHRGELL